MIRLAALLGLLGLAAATGVVLWSGWEDVWTALEQAGWGILAVALFHLVQLFVSSAGWRILMPPRNRPSYGAFLLFMWVRASVNALMPVARIGGEIAAIRLMTAYGLPRNKAIALTIAELTLSVIAIFLFVTLGVLGFALRVNDQHVTAQLGWGLLVSLPLIGGLGFVQKIGFFSLLSRLFRVMFREKWARFAGGAARLDKAVGLVYRRHGRALACGVIQFGAWSLGSVEIWLSLFFLQHPVSLWDAALIEALIQGSASAAFAIPGALGVQEAGFLLFGGLLGLPPPLAGALAMMRRGRDLLCYVPGLAMWQAHEGKRLFKK